MLRAISSVTPDDTHVMAALFSSDQSEVAGCIHQHAGPLAKHINIMLLASPLSAACVVEPAVRAQADGSRRRPDPGNRLWPLRWF
jgi:hypothetical protein